MPEACRRLPYEGHRFGVPVSKRAGSMRSRRKVSDVRSGSKADMTRLDCDVGYTPESGHRADVLECPPSGRSGHRHDQLAFVSELANGGTLFTAWETYGRSRLRRYHEAVSHDFSVFISAWSTTSAPIHTNAASWTQRKVKRTAMAALEPDARCALVCTTRAATTPTDNTSSVAECAPAACRRARSRQTPAGSRHNWHGRARRAGITAIHAARRPGSFSTRPSRSE